MADLYGGISPYSFGFNSPTNFNDPTGLSPGDWWDDFTGLLTKKETYYFGYRTNTVTVNPAKAPAAASNTVKSGGGNTTNTTAGVINGAAVVVNVATKVSATRATAALKVASGSSNTMGSSNGNNSGKSQTEKQRLNDIVTIRGSQYHKNTNNIFAEIGNKINSTFGGSPDYFVEKKPYDPVEDNAMQNLVANSVGGAGGILLKQGAGLVFRTIAVEKTYINLASSGRTAHIIAGDVGGGGHAWFGSLKSFISGLNGAKSKFPMTWSNSKIMNAVSDVAVNNQWIQQTGKAGAMTTKSGIPVRFVVEGTYQGTKIRVITTHTDIITAFPIK